MELQNNAGMAETAASNEELASIAESLANIGGGSMNTGAVDDAFLNASPEPLISPQAGTAGTSGVTVGGGTLEASAQPSQGAQLCPPGIPPGIIPGC